MRPIVSGITTLVQHMQQLFVDPDRYRPKQCVSCGRAGLWCHGSYERQSDRENPSASSLNPILIPRFYCPDCCHTCSTLPECIPPHRWYLWSIQQAALLIVLSGKSIHHSARHCLPSRFSVSRWYHRLVEQFQHHRLHLSASLPSLGYKNNFATYWQTCFAQLNLSGAMFMLNQAEVMIP